MMRSMFSFFLSYTSMFTLDDFTRPSTVEREHMRNDVPRLSATLQDLEDDSTTVGTDPTSASEYADRRHNRSRRSSTGENSRAQTADHFFPNYKNLKQDEESVMERARALGEEL